MELSKLDAETLGSLNNALGGLLEALQTHCCQVHLSVQTQLNGLEEGEMKLYIQVVKDGETADYAVAKLRNSAAQIIGWNIYLHDLTDSIKGGLARANAKIDAAAEGARLEH